MAGINKVILLGNVGRDPEIRSLENGGKVAQFSLATNENYKEKDGNCKEQTEWHNIVAWNYQADKAEQFLHKGAQVYIEGKIRTRQWTDKENVIRYTTDIIAEKILLLGRKNEGQNFPPIPDENNYVKPKSSTTTPDSNINEPEITSDDQKEDDLPF